MSKIEIGKDYVMLKKGDRIQEEDEYSRGDGIWCESENKYVMNIELTYRRKKPYYPDYRQPNAPVREVQVLWAETPPFVPKKPDAPKGWYYLGESESSKNGDRYICFSGNNSPVIAYVGRTVSELKAMEDWKRGWAGIIRQTAVEPVDVKVEIGNTKIEPFGPDWWKKMQESRAQYEAFQELKFLKIRAEENYKQALIEIGKLKDKLFDVEKHCRGVESINAGLNRKLKEAEARIAELQDAGLPMSTATKDDFKYIQLYMGGRWMKGSWGSNANAWLSAGFEHSKLWDLENQPIMWKPLA
jgi:hypothetical protein